ncbi:MAG: sxtJ [Woeseiaceae bacterium]|nr:sxtJ [Woeseiaceae bacterium]
MDTPEIPELDSSGLRRFGFTTGAIVAVLFGVLLPYLFEHAWPRWPWVLAAILFSWATVAPGTLRLVYRGWMRIGLLIGKIMTPVILTLVYVIAVIPTAIILRISGKDLLHRDFDDSPSYRVESKEPSIDNMEKPF